MNLSLNSILEGQLLLLDKPLEWTSFQVVNKLRWAFKKKYHLKKLKVGHAGTLDPLASGLLLICTGKLTKKISEIQALEKVYTGTITLGATTPSFDLETAFDQHFPIDHINLKMLEQAKKQFEGTIEQCPPIFSAIKKDGKRLYEYARKGESTAIKPRKITVSQFDLTQIDLPNIQFSVQCSKGTYIRSLAHDFGQALNSGAYLSELRRTAIGPYSVDNAIDPEQLVDKLLGISS
ncbi:MAG: tRNA pseudouridine(55) synthase TruB [Flavobacteriaceae bacterium]